MKKIQTLFLCLTTIIAFTSCSNTHSLASQPPNPGSYKIGDSTSKSAQVNEKILNKFYKMYGNVTDISWSQDDEKNYCAHFKNNAKTVRAAFTRRAVFVYSISYYSQESLPTDILRRVKEIYFKKNISYVIEVTTNGKTAYLMGLEDNVSWKTIKMLDGEITEQELYLK